MWNLWRPSKAKSLRKKNILVNNSAVAFNERSFKRWLSRTYNSDGTPKVPNPSPILPDGAQELAMVSVKCSTDGEPFEVSKWLFDSKTERFGDKAFFHCERHIQRGPRRR